MSSSSDSSTASYSSSEDDFRRTGNIFSSPRLPAARSGSEDDSSWSSVSFNAADLPSPAAARGEDDGHGGASQAHKQHTREQFDPHKLDQASMRRPSRAAVPDVD